MFPLYVFIMIWIVRLQMVEWGTVKYLRYIFKYVSALNRNVSGAEMFSCRYGLCCKQTALCHHSWETLLVGEVRLCRSYLADQTECMSYRKDSIKFDAD